VLTGSTRLKAGTATKILLNGFSTALMVRFGLTYSNLMVSVMATNQKLRERTLRILGEVTGGDLEAGARILAAADGDLKVAVVSAVTGFEIVASQRALDEARGSVPGAVRALSGRV
jgi:N-acetylmuramic acid 6-phosphate etherase